MKYDIQIGNYNFIYPFYQICSIAFCYFFGIILHLSFNIRFDIIGRIVSTINALCISYYSIMFAFGYTDQETFVGAYSLMVGYMIYDIFFMFKALNYKIKQALPYLIHHSVVVISQCTIRDFAYTYAIASLSEIPTIFLNISWYLVKYNRRGLLLKYIGYILGLSYFITRPLIFTCLNIYFYIISFTNIMLVMLPLVTVLNYYWFFKLYMKIRTEIKYIDKIN
jgi:hypothetical protein